MLVWMHGGLATLLGWLTALPDAEFATRPKLAVNHAFILVAMDDLTLSERRLDAAEHALQRAAEPDTLLVGQAAVCRTAIALLSEGAGSSHDRRRATALELFPAEQHDLARAHEDVPWGWTIMRKPARSTWASPPWPKQNRMARALAMPSP